MEKEKVIFGAEIFCDNLFKNYLNRNIAILSNQSSIVFDKFSVVDCLKKKGLKIKKIFFPQHGFMQDKQDDMKESFDYKKDGINFISLYGERFTPSDEHLKDIDTIIYDLQDVGVRIYTFVSTLYLLLKSLQKKDIEVIILDRPNPLGGEKIEGNMVEEDYFSFVGIYSLPLIYSLTPGELAIYFKEKERFDIKLKIIKLKNWNRKKTYYRLGRFWYPPSPNMPFISTTLVYPATVLLEGTNVSEGRGTTRPFEIIGAPFIDSEKFSKVVNTKKINGVNFIPYDFEPTFGKWKNKPCGGVFLRVTNFKNFKPYLTGLKIIKTIRDLYENNFLWKLPPYEYEYKLKPIDIITGTNKIRKYINKSIDFNITDFFNNSERNFRNDIDNILIYKK